MEQIIVNNIPTSEPPRSSILQQSEAGRFFEDFIDYVRQSDVKPKGLTPRAVATFRSETADILNHCNPHNAVSNPETTHLVVGYVQSGKTMSFTGLTALAKDNGYKVIIYLAGTKNNLLDQTQKRLRKDLVRDNDAFINEYKIHVNPSLSDAEDIVGLLESNDHPIVLIPILKHYEHILRVKDLVNHTEFKEVMANETVIIIDDEADQASLNSFGRKNSKKKEDEKSRTYDAILQLRAVLPGNTYIQYTATPQANILISIQDLLSPKSHTLLTPGDGYIGGQLFFGKGPNHALFNGGLIIKIPKAQVFHKKDNPLNQIPQSLQDALMLHILAVAIVVEWQKVDGVKFLSMMVHPDNTKEWNRAFKDWVETELNKWRKLMKKTEDNLPRTMLLQRFHSLMPMALKFYDIDEQPSFEEIKPHIAEVLKSKKVWLVNTDVDAQTNIDWKAYKMHVLVGAEMLNRGFTIENLATTYMPRYTKGATNADTIQQRCRFFGYKSDYIKSCRVFLPEISIQNYWNYIAHEEELRSTLASCDSLAAAERKILLSPTLRPTRANVLPIWVVTDRLRGMRELQAYASKSSIESNNVLVADFLCRHENDWTVREDTTLDRTHRWMKLSIDEAIQFLGDFNFKNWPDAQQKANTVRYLRYLSSMQGDNRIEYVYFYQMAFGAPVRHRSFDPSTRKLCFKYASFRWTKFCTGLHYLSLGDDKIVGPDDSLTIQLYHLHLDGAEMDFAQEAYTLAIYYPPKLAASYCSNERANIDDQDEEEDDDE